MLCMFVLMYQHIDFDNQDLFVSIFIQYHARISCYKHSVVSRCNCQLFHPFIISCSTGEEMEVKRLSVRGLLPETDYYMTYDGSTTMPACYETVTWLILNKPIYITKQQVRCACTPTMQFHVKCMPFMLPFYASTSLVLLKNGLNFL